MNYVVKMQSSMIGLLALFLAFELLVPWPVLAQSAPAAPPAVPTAAPASSPAAPLQRMNLDLSSSARSIPAVDAIPTSNYGRSPVQIVTGSTARIISPSDLLTPAEFVALSQIMTTGRQTLSLNAAGTAIGGNFALSAALSQAISALSIPQGVTVVRNFGAASALSLAGNLTNAGTFYAFSSSPTVTTASITAANITNAGLLTTVLPNLTILGVTSAVPNLNLSLAALGDIKNFGTISSAGNLSATAGGSIINGSPSGVGGPPPAIHAANNISLFSGSGNFVNSGTVSAAAGNIDVASQQSADILFNNNGGTLQAPNGSINIRDAMFEGKAGIRLTGGDLVAKELNAYSGQGAFEANVQQVQGKLNTYGSEAHVVANSETLTLGDVCLSGDPTYYNNGNISLTGDISVSENLAIVASGNITSMSGLSSIKSNGGGQGHDIYLVAGAAISPACGSCTGTMPPGTPATTSVNVGPGPSATGGDINLEASPGVQIDAASTSGNLPGGNVYLIAYHGTSFPSGTGQIRFNAPAVGEIKTSGSGSGTNGDVKIVAGASGSGWSSVPRITAYGGTGAGGAIFMSTSQPTTSDGYAVTFGTNGSVSSGNIFAENPAAEVSGYIGLLGDVTAKGVLTLNATWIAPTDGIVVSGASIIANGSSGGCAMYTPGLTPATFLSRDGNITIQSYSIFFIRSNLPNTLNLNTGGTGNVSIVGNLQVDTGFTVQSNSNVVISAPALINNGAISVTGSGHTLAVNSPGPGDLLVTGTGTLSAAGISFTSSGGSVNVVQNSFSGTLSGSAANDYNLLPATGALVVGPITASNGALNIIGDAGISVVAPLTAKTLLLDAAWTTANGNGTITLGASVSGSTQAALKAGGTGSITQSISAVAISTPALILRSGEGDIGGSGPTAALFTAVNGTLDVSTGGNGLVNINNIGALVLQSSSAGASFSLTNSGSLTVNSLTTADGQIALKAATGTLSVASGSTISAVGGRVTLQNTDVTHGRIAIGSNVTILDLVGSSGNIGIFLGGLPSATNPAPPANVSAQTSSGAQVFFGLNSIAASPPTNLVVAKGAGTQISFDTGGAPASSITLGGNDNIRAGTNTVILSLDLTDPTVAPVIKAAQNQGALGGSLTLNSANQAVGGTLILMPLDVASSISGLNVPAGVFVTFNGFTENFPVNVSITSASHTDQVPVNGTVQFSGQASNRTLTISSDQNPTAFSVGTTGTISTTGSLTITANGALAVNGRINGAVTLETTNAANGDISGAATFTSSTGPIKIHAAGSIALTGSIYQYSGVRGVLDFNAGGGITSRGTIYATGGPVSFKAAGTFANFGSISSSNGPIFITADSVVFAGPVRAGWGPVILNTSTPGQLISIGVDTPGAFNISNKTLQQINASVLEIGDTDQTGGILVGSTINLSNFSLALTTGGNYSAAGQTLNIGSKPLVVTALGTVDTGTISGSFSSVVTVTAGTGLTVSGPITAPNGTVVLTTTDDGNISWGSNSIGGGGTAPIVTVLHADGTGELTGTATISGATINLTSGSGNIGDTGSPLTIRATNFTAHTDGNVFINATSALNLVGPSAAGGTGGFNLTAAGNLTLSRWATVSVAGGNPLNLATTASNGSIIQLAAGTSLIGAQISLNAGSGNLASIGSVSVPVGITSGIAGTPVSLTANAGGSIYISGNNSSSGSGAISIAGSSSSGGQFRLYAAGPIALGGNSITARGSISLTATGANGSITQSGTSAGPPSLISPNLVLNASADLGTSSQNPLVIANITGTTNPVTLTASGVGNVFLASATSISLNGSSAAGGPSGFQLVAGGNILLSNGARVTGNTAITLTAGAGGSITQSGAGTTLVSPFITLSADSSGSTGSIGGATVPVRTGNPAGAQSSVLLQFTAGKNVYVGNTGAVTLATSTAGGQFVLSSTGNVVFSPGSEPVSAGVSAQVTTAGGITQGNGVAVALSAPAITLSSGTAGIGTVTDPFAISEIAGSTNLTASAMGALHVSANSSVTIKSATAYGGIAISTTGSASNLQTTGNITDYLGGGIALNAGGTLTVASTTSMLGTGPLQLIANNGALRVAGIITEYNGLVQLASTGGAITSSGAVCAYNGSITMTSSSDAINISGGTLTAIGTGANGNFQLTANGNITVGGTINANTLSIQTTGSSNGSITLNSTISASHGFSATTAGSGTFSTAANTYLYAPYGPASITTAALSLSGIIFNGSNTVALNTNDPTQPISVGAATPGSFNVSSTVLRQISTGTIAIGNASQTGGIAVTSRLSLPNSNIALTTAGNYSSAGQSLTLVYARSLTVSAQGACDTGTVNTSGYSNITFSAGTGLTVSGQINAPYGRVSLLTTGPGSINVNANAGVASATSTSITSASGNVVLSGSSRISSSGTVSITANGAGSSIIQNGPGVSIAAQNILLQADTTMGTGGGIGTPAQSIGVVHVSGARYPVSVSAAAGSGVYIRSSGSMTIGNVSTNMPASSGEGAIILSSDTGLLKIGASSHITANGGSVTIQNLDTTGAGKIEIGPSAAIHASSTASSAGQVNVVIGPVPVNPQTSAKPPYVTVNESDGGRVFFGTNGITASPPANTLNATGRNIIFDTGNQPKNLITLDGNVTITADPPASGTDTDLTPIAYAEPAAPANRAIEKIFERYSTGLIGTHHRYALYAPRNSVDVNIVRGQLQIGAGALVLVVSDADNVAVYDLHDKHCNDVTLTVAGRSMVLAPGRHVLLTNRVVESLDQVNPLQSVGHRSISVHELGCGLKAISSEFSIVSALNTVKPLLQMQQSDSRCDMQIVRKIIKDAAIIQSVKGSGGLYRCAYNRSE